MVSVNKFQSLINFADKSISLFHRLWHSSPICPTKILEPLNYVFSSSGGLMSQIFAKFKQMLWPRQLLKFFYWDIEVIEEQPLSIIMMSISDDVKDIDSCLVIVLTNRIIDYTIQEIRTIRLLKTTCFQRWLWTFELQVQVITFIISMSL